MPLARQLPSRPAVQLPSAPTRRNYRHPTAAPTCYNCGCQEMAIKRLGGLKEGQRPWSVKVCNDCLTTWNRDVSAANVIRVLLLLKLMGFERPTKLQRPPWPPAAAGPG
ncbi:hypothetical protein CHLRE_02g145602v5 [Chlamydomonas reinhardtii]|uniref:Uncharacterized protein n=1 Tax=Chlamydomonas reinhardtii TaxID=3055 RepID=A0A2K3E3T5_CHLRE|nr:uncharacterized protein CHLRE_02g145602v5 [Chlamydomonas reinhardtii]PNW87436.1 hypothetical protein CHLRE_02g145602v5 [Chlamydomonas reinhardtii]